MPQDCTGFACTDPTGRQVRNAYNTQNYLQSVTVENGAADIVTTFGRNSAGDIVSVTDPLSRVHTGTYDASRRLTRYDGPAGTGAASEWRYNGDGLVDRVRQATGLAAPAPAWAETTYVYYDTGRVARMTDPGAFAARMLRPTFARDAAVMLLSTTWSSWKARRFQPHWHASRMSRMRAKRDTR